MPSLATRGFIAYLFFIVIVHCSDIVRDVALELKHRIPLPIISKHGSTKKMLKRNVDLQLETVCYKIPLHYNTSYANYMEV